MSNPSVQYGRWFYADAWRAGTGRSTRATLTGAGHCHFGTEGGFNCGNVVTVIAEPGNNCGLDANEPCNPVFVEVHGPQLYCTDGDSGGPWFTAGTIAAGIHMADHEGAVTGAGTPAPIGPTATWASI